MFTAKVSYIHDPFITYLTKHMVIITWTMTKWNSSLPNDILAIIQQVSKLTAITSTNHRVRLNHPFRIKISRKKANNLHPPIVSRIQPTVPSPPQHMTLKLSTSLNICRPCMGPPIARLWTWRGFRMYWNLRSMRSPCRPPDLGLMKTRRGVVLGRGVIWKDMAGCCWGVWVEQPVDRKPPWRNLSFFTACFFLYFFVIVELIALVGNVWFCSVIGELVVLFECTLR